MKGTCIFTSVSGRFIAGKVSNYFANSVLLSVPTLCWNLLEGPLDRRLAVEFIEGDVVHMSVGLLVSGQSE
jgi:hypothetical protein